LVLLSSIIPMRTSKLLLLFAIEFFVSSSVIGSPIPGKALIIFIILTDEVHGYISKTTIHYKLSNLGFIYCNESTSTFHEFVDFIHQF
jgi:hypothetical protein